MTAVLKPRNALRLVLAGALLVPFLPLYAQDARPPMAAPQVPLIVERAVDEIEEVVVLGRFRSASQQLLDERLNDDSVSDVLDADTISRLGDSTVASALRRVPGLSLVGGRFVYIRGLGERYSATSLNGARIPSPDLTRNVIPLDIFPTSTVQSLKVQKTWSPELPANFGGGSVEIRTKGVPNGFNASLEVGSGYNSNLGGDFLSYPGSSNDDFGADDGSRAVSATLLSQVDYYQGNVGVQGILNRLRADDPSATLADAQRVNRQLSLQLNRDIGLERRSAYPDIGLQGTAGTRFDAGDNFEFGVQTSGAYDTQWRKSLAKSRNFNFPGQRTNTEDESTRTVSLSGTLNLGMRFTEDHEFETTTLYLRNTDNETAVRDYFNENREVQDGIGFRNYRFQFEQRDMLVQQLKATHRFGEATRQMLPDMFDGLLNLLPEDTVVSWFHSDAKAETRIPNQVEISSQTVTDPIDRRVLDESVTLDATAANYRFTELDDELQNFGWMAVVPFYSNDSIVETSFGYQHDRKVRTYRQLQFSLGALNVADVGVLGGTLDSVFSDANILNPGNNYVFDIRGTNNQSYIAATMTDAVFGKVDWTWKDTWRLALGARWEDYRQVALDWNPFGYSETDPQITTDPEALARATFASDSIFPSASVSYIGDLWAETFQLRFGWSETAIRPDLREITDASYVDPVTNDLVDGNPGVVPSAVHNYDLRAEWFFASGDNFTLTLFHKQIDKPIEFFESAASDTTVAREIINADRATVTGIEIEAFKELGFLGSVFDSMFLQGNLTVQDSELLAGPAADAPTNAVRGLTGASNYVANVAIGFDSADARHSASVAYNVFGERLYVAGRNGAPDGFEQPFHSLDLTYAWFPGDTLTIKARATNLLGEQLEIERAGIVTFEEDPGSSYSLSFTWAL